MQLWYHIRRSQGADANQPPHADTGTKPKAAFNLFPELPVELRLLIWNHALEQPRAIFITHKHISDRKKLGLLAYPCWRCPITGKRYKQTSALLFVNHEARAVALNYDRYSFFSVGIRKHAVPGLRFAATPNDFVVIAADELLRASPEHTIRITRSEGFAQYDGTRRGYHAPVVRRFLILQNEDQLKSNEGLIAHVARDSKRGTPVYRLIANEALKHAEHVIKSPNAADFESIHCLAPGWTAREPHGLRSLEGLPDIDTSVWDSHPLLDHIAMLYYREIEGDPRAGGNGNGVETLQNRLSSVSEVELTEASAKLSTMKLDDTMTKIADIERSVESMLRRLGG